MVHMIKEEANLRRGDERTNFGWTGFLVYSQGKRQREQGYFDFPVGR